MLTRIEEITLIAKCIAADDRDAFGRLVEEYSGGLRHFLINLTGGDGSLSDDLAQEAFIKAYTSIRSFKGVSKFKTWLYTIAYREFLNWRRGSGAVTDGLDSIASMSDGDPTPERAAESAHDVEVAMRALSETERTLVVLFYIEDMPVKKIAEITSMPQGTVKVYLKRARERMARVLCNEDN